MRHKISAFILGLFLLVSMTGISPASAFTETDEIEKYTITARMCEDATVELHYHIEWRVLDDEIYGPLDWVQIGIPNSSCVQCYGESGNVSSVEINGGNPSFAEVYFNERYYENDLASFDFCVVQDRMYEVDKLEDGYTVVSFTPGWFDEIKVDELTINWSVDNTYGWSPSCDINDEFLTWTTSLGYGEKYSITVTYPNEAYAFDLSRQMEFDGYGDGDYGYGDYGYDDYGYDDYGYGDYDSDDDELEDWEAVLILLFLPIILPISCFPFTIVIIIVIVCIVRYKRSANFGTSNATTTKITRTKIEYYPSCPGCGAAREEGVDKCKYCGNSFIKSEVILKEEEIPAEEKDILNYKTDGTYRYSSSPNVYIRVHTVRVPVSRPSSSYSSRSGAGRSSGSGGRGGSRSSCAHSSCAHSSCAHSSCACACACACAGGGRAGCTNKDFYNTNLKLSQLLKRRGKGWRV